MKAKGVYTSPIDHLKDELDRLTLILELTFIQRKVNNSVVKEPYSDLYIPEDDVIKLLKAEAPLEITPEQENLITQINSRREQIDNRLSHTLSEGYLLPFDQIRKQFELSQLETDILLIVLAPAIDVKYQKIYAYLQDDLTKVSPTLQLILLLLSHSFEEQAIIRHYLSKSSSLQKWRLLNIRDDDSERQLITSPIHIDERMVSFILGTGEIDSESGDYLELLNPGEPLTDIALDPLLKGKVENLTTYLSTDTAMEQGNILYLKGPKGSGRTRVAQSICDTLNIPLLKLNISSLRKFPPDDIPDIIHRTVRELLLIQGAIVIEHFDELISTDPNLTDIKNRLLKELSQYSYLTFLIGSKNHDLTDTWTARYIELVFPVPGFSLRKQIWEQHIAGSNGHGHSLKTLSPEKLAGMYHFTEGQIAGAMSFARDKSLSQNDIHDSFDENLLTGCRAQSNRKLSELSQKVKTPFTWHDIILPEEQIAQLKEISLYLKHKHQVFDQWGFKAKISSGRGVNVLFSGVSGTGKTMSAGIIANELNLELYKIDLSSVVSKYIGETEKNLDKIFTEAETSNAILFFDEADALFGKRSEIKDAHDRYANIETGYLLQKMEDYGGMCILATNLRQNMDDAFTRRMQFIVEFHSPDERQRRQIWQRIYPSETPMADDIDFDFLSERLKLSGGHIKNMALASAFYAAAASSGIQMTHIIHAAKREYQKLGKAFMKKDFEPYD